MSDKGIYLSIIFRQKLYDIQTKIASSHLYILNVKIKSLTIKICPKYFYDASIEGDIVA